MADGDLILETGVMDMLWRLQELQGVRMLRSGLSQVNQMSEPFWSFELLTCWLEKPDYQAWDQWLTDRRGSASTFTAWDMSRPNALVPVSSDAGLTVTGYDRAASTVSFGGTGAWTASKGDKVSFYTAAGGYWLGMAMEVKAASGSAMTALKVHPAPFEPHASTPAPRRIRALGEFQLRLPLAQSTNRVDDRRVAFAADQMIRG